MQARNTNNEFSKKRNQKNGDFQQTGQYKKCLQEVNKSENNKTLNFHKKIRNQNKNKDKTIKTISFTLCNNISVAKTKTR